MVARACAGGGGWGRESGAPRRSATVCGPRAPFAFLSCAPQRAERRPRHRRARGSIHREKAHLGAIALRLGRRRWLRCGGGGGRGAASWPRAAQRQGKLVCLCTLAPAFLHWKKDCCSLFASAAGVRQSHIVASVGTSRQPYARRSHIEVTHITPGAAADPQPSTGARDRAT